jgi:hypothetical protein
MVVWGSEMLDGVITELVTLTPGLFRDEGAWAGMLQRNVMLFSLLMGKSSVTWRKERIFSKVWLIIIFLQVTTGDM